MNSIFIIYNQVLTEQVIAMLDELHIRGFTRWTGVHGRGSESGEPRMGTHTWPALNDAILSVVEDNGVEEVLRRIREIDEAQPEQGIRAFVWDVKQSV